MSAGWVRSLLMRRRSKQSIRDMNGAPQGQRKVATYGDPETTRAESELRLGAALFEATVFWADWVMRRIDSVQPLQASMEGVNIPSTASRSMMFGSHMSGRCASWQDRSSSRARDGAAHVHPERTASQV